MLDSAKLHYCYSNVIGAAFSALSSSACPAPPPVWLPLGLFVRLCFAGLSFCLSVSLVDLACFLCFFCFVSFSPALTQAQWMEICLTVRSLVSGWFLVGYFLHWKDADTALLWPTTQDSRIASARKGRLLLPPFVLAGLLFSEELLSNLP